MSDQIVSRMFAALACAKLIAVALFFASFIPASHSLAANETQPVVDSCNGMDLVAKMQAENPGKLTDIRLQAKKIINGETIFWKVEMENAEPSWLLGTMHMTDPEVTTLSDRAQDALEKTGTIVIESTETLDPAKASAALVQLNHLTFLQAGETLTNLLPGEYISKLKTQLEPRGIPLKIASRLQPWVIATMIGVPVCELQAKQSGMKILDHQIAQHALDTNKKLVGLETTEEQFSAIASLPENFHLSALKETLTLGSERVEDMIATMKSIYKSGDISLLMPFMKAISPKAYSGEGMAEFQDALITKRNRLMAERAVAILDKGNAFVAVGALHLPGDTGLVKLLRDRGYRLTAVKQ